MTPHPHDRHIDEYLLILYSKDGCEECITKLYKAHHKMIADYMRKHIKKLRCLTYDDLVGQAYHYFLDAIRKFDIDTGLKFSNFLHHNLRQINRYVVQYDNVITRPTNYLTLLKAGEVPEISSYSLDSSVDPDEQAFGRSYGEITEDTSIADIGEVIDIKKLLEAVEALPERQRVSIKEHVLKGTPKAQIASQFGCKTETITNEINRAMLTLRNAML